MYITCQKCDTVFRLDERLLKPTGSKVRCSQCGNIFVAVPPAPTEVELEPGLEDALWSDTPPSDAAQEKKESPGEATGAAVDSAVSTPEETATARESSRETPAESDAALIDIDFDAEFDVETPASNASAAEPPTDILSDLDLDADFTLDNEKPLTADADQTESAAGRPEPSLDLELRGLFLDEEKKDLPSPVPAAADVSLDEDFAQALKNLDQQMDDNVTLFVDMSDSPDDGVEMGDLDLELDLGQAASSKEPETTAAQPQTGTGSDLDLNLDLEEELQLDLAALETPSAGESGLATAKDAVEAGDELNFSDLDALLETGDDSPAVEDRPEVELSLDMGDDNAPAAVSDATADLEELTLELDTAYKDKHVTPAEEKSSPEPAGDEEEIDLSDIELMLEEGEAEPARPKWSSGQQADLEPESGEFDLSELEAAIEEVGTQPDREAADEKEEDLELSLPLGSEAPRLDDPAEKAIELDLEDLEGLKVEEERPPRPETLGDSDMELEFQVEEAVADSEIPAAVAPNADAKPTPAAAPAAVPDIDTIPIAPPAYEELLEKPEAMRAEKKSSAALVALVVIVLLAALGFGLYYAVTQMGVHIPYVSDYLKPVEQDPAGVRRLSTPEINSKFIENSQSGRLFVISGKVLNGYPEARTTIRLQGKLFTKGKKLAKAEFVYAGIMIDDQAVASGTVADIKKRLDTAPQPQDPAAKVLPNQSLPFMVVFSDLPDTSELDEFAVEPVGSMPVK